MHNVYGIGRWGEHSHYNSDVAVELALKLVDLYFPGAFTTTLRMQQYCGFKFSVVVLVLQLQFPESV